MSNFWDKLTQTQLEAAGAYAAIQEASSNFAGLKNASIVAGLQGDGEDETDRFQWLANRDDFTEFFIPYTDEEYKISEPIVIKKRGLKFVGNGKGRVEDRATVLAYYGDGDMFRIGEEGGTVEYQGTTFQNISMVARSTTRSALNNPYAKGTGRGWYVPNTTAVRDWKGGHVKLRNVQFENFDRVFWGLHSDFNEFDLLSIFYTKNGVHLDDLNDQFLGTNWYTFGNDKALTMYGQTSGAEFRKCNFVKEGSATDIPIDIDGPFGVLFNACWFEGLGNYGVTVPTYIRAGVTRETRDLIIRDSTLAIGAKINGTQPILNYFVENVRCRNLWIEQVLSFPHNLKKITSFSGSSSIQRTVLISSFNFTPEDGTYHDNNGTGAANLLLQKYGDDGLTTQHYLNGVPV